jgi:hypothetical protein
MQINMPTSQAMPRPACAVLDPGVLSSTLRQFVKAPGWFKYGEQPSSPVDSSVLVAHKELFKSLTELAPNLSFTKADVQAAFRQLGEEANFPALNTDALLIDWITTMTTRLRLACRHISKARTHRPPPSWLEHIDGPPPGSTVASTGGARPMLASADGAASAAGEAAVEAAAAADEAKLERTVVSQCLLQALLQLVHFLSTPSDSLAR